MGCDLFNRQITVCIMGKNVFMNFDRKRIFGSILLGTDLADDLHISDFIVCDIFIFFDKLIERQGGA